MRLCRLVVARIVPQPMKYPRCCDVSRCNLVDTGEILKIRLRFVSYSFCILFLYYGIIEYGFVQLPNCHDQFPEFRDFYRRHAISYFEEISQLEDRGNRISCLVTIDSSTLIDRSKTFYISCCSISLNRNRLAYTRTHTYIHIHIYTHTRCISRWITEKFTSNTFCDVTRHQVLKINRVGSRKA